VKNKRDAVEAEIVQALEATGCTVSRISAAGVPDLLVGRAGANVLLEVKSDGGRLTAAQVEWHATWRGQAAVVYSVAEALEEVNHAIQKDRPRRVDKPQRTEVDP
jgi:hypothetical protein